jgi:hypothetical protein
MHLATNRSMLSSGVMLRCYEIQYISRVIFIMLLKLQTLALYFKVICIVTHMAGIRNDKWTFIHGLQSSYRTTRLQILILTANKCRNCFMFLMCSKLHHVNWRTKLNEWILKWPLWVYIFQDLDNHLHLFTGFQGLQFHSLPLECTRG